MNKGSARLLNEDGSFRCFITQGEGARGVRSREMRRVRLANSPKTIFQLIKYPSPSNSRSDMPTITVRDMMLTVGIQRLDKTRETEDFERLIGFGLIPENTPFPKHGYL